MDQIITTIAIAFVFVSLAIAGLAIGWLITGRSKLKGRCGQDPTKNRDDSCTTSCDLCERNEDKNGKK